MKEENPHNYVIIQAGLAVKGTRFKKAKLSDSVRHFFSLFMCYIFRNGKSEGRSGFATKKKKKKANPNKALV